MRSSYAYNTFGIDGVTTNPRHIMLSGKPFLTAITDIANWIKEEGLEGVREVPRLRGDQPPSGRHRRDDRRRKESLPPSARTSSSRSPATEAGVAAARRLEKEGIRTNVTLVFSPAQAILARKERLPLRFSVPGLERGQR